MGRSVILATCANFITFHDDYLNIQTKAQQTLKITFLITERMWLESQKRLGQSDEIWIIDEIKYQEGNDLSSKVLNLNIISSRTKAF